MNRQILAIVIGGGLNALGIVRSLAAENVPLLVIDTNLNTPAMRSRYGDKLLSPALEGDVFIQFLLALSTQLQSRPMLFLTEEKTVTTISLQRTAIIPHFIICLPDHQCLTQLMHKQGFQELAERYAAPIPRTIRIQNPSDLPKADSLQFPCVFKPSVKSDAYGALFKKAYKVSNNNEVAHLYQEIHPIQADMVLQEWIEGEDSEIYFCLQYIAIDGELVSSFTGRKIRSWPPKIGGTASCTAAWEENHKLTALTYQFFRQVGFVGMGSMEYKRDQRNGLFYMVEPTIARSDFQEEVATLNGCNLPYVAYCHEMHFMVPQSIPQQPPKIWRDALTERWSREESRGTDDKRSAGYPVVDAYWRWNDPRPWIDFMLSRLQERFNKLVKLR